MQNTDPGETWWGSCTEGFWCSPEKLPVGVVVYQCSTLRDLDAIKQMAILHLKTAHKPTPVFGERRFCATTCRSRDVKFSKLVYNITNSAISWVVWFWACPMSQTSPEDGGVFIGNNMGLFAPWRICSSIPKGLRHFHLFSLHFLESQNVNMDGLDECWRCHGDLLCRNSVIWVFAERDTEQSRFQISWCSRFYSISFQTRATKKQAVILFSFKNKKIEIEI